MAGLAMGGLAMPRTSPLGSPAGRVDGGVGATVGGGAGLLEVGAGLLEVSAVVGGCVAVTGGRLAPPHAAATMMMASALDSVLMAG